MTKTNWNEAPQWADQFGKVGSVDLEVWTNGARYKYLESGKEFDFGFDGFPHEDFTLLERRPDIVITQTSELLPEETYTIKLDSDSMNEAVVKFLTQCYRDNQMFREDDGIQDSILDVIRFCTTASEYDSILAELGIE